MTDHTIKLPPFKWEMYRSVPAGPALRMIENYARLAVEQNTEELRAELARINDINRKQCDKHNINLVHGACMDEQMAALRARVAELEREIESLEGELDMLMEERDSLKFKVDK